MTYGKDTMEEEANLFARCLLMPEELVRREAKRLAAGRTVDLLDDNDTFIRDLAKAFGVPLMAMTLRLRELELITL